MLAPALHYAVLGLIIVAGSVLRLTGLGRQSLWFDEVDVVVRAQRPLDAILDTFTAAGENGPVYNLFLWAWVRIAGISEIAVRFPSAVAGALAIPLIYLLGRRLAGRTAGLVSAGLLAINPYHVWYSQEAKMYAMIVVLAILSSLLLVEALNRNTIRLWIGYVAVTTLMFYTHVTTILVFVAQAMFILATFQSWRDRLRPLLLSGAALTLPYIPIAIWAWRVVGGGARTWQPDVSLWEAVRIVGIKFAANRSEVFIEERLALMMAALAILGAAALVARRRLNESGVLLITLAVIPVIGIYLASVRNSVFSDRYVLISLPAYLILAAVGIVILWRHRYIWPIGVIALVLIFSYSWATLRDVNLADSAEKEDWRSAYALVAEEALPDDVILTHPGYTLTTYQYFSQREPRLERIETITIPTFRVNWLNEQNMVEWIVNRVGQPDRLWYIESPDRVLAEDPERTLEGWLEGNSDIVEERVYNGVRVLLFDIHWPDE
jgi:mannosyltransferase